MENIGEQIPQQEEAAVELKEQLELVKAENVALKTENAKLKNENAALKVENADLKIDSVTGLPTRRELDKKIAESEEKIDAIQEGGPEKEPSNETAVMMLDIDNFKTVNDLYGHPNGDVILRAVADKLKEMFRKEDRIMRYGGEEIAVILEKTDAKRLINKFYDPTAGKPRLTVKATILHEGKEEEVEVSLSGGLSAMGPDGDLRSALAEADKALYIAKNGVRAKDGTLIAAPRDRIVLYSEETGNEQGQVMEAAA